MIPHNTRGCFMSTKVSIDIKGFNQAAKDLFQVPGITVGMEGRNGIGKSALAFQIGEEMNLPVVEIRLGQMTEGDLIGLPDLEGEGEDLVGKIGKAFSKAGEIDAELGGPEDIVGDVAAAGVAIAGLFSGRSVKTHKDSFVTPKYPNFTYESVATQQIG